MEKLDDIHIDFSGIDGAGKQFNLIISPREDGKTTMFVCKKAYPAWKKGQSTIIQLRQKVELSEDLIDTYVAPIRKYLNPDFQVSYKKSGINSGLLPVYADGHLLYYFVCFSTDMHAIKSRKIENPAFWWCDEFIIDPTLGEKYLPKEAKRFDDAFTTFRRENPGIKVYFTGNPYTLYSPYLEHFHFGPEDFHFNKIITKGHAALWWKGLNPVLYEKVKKSNPLFDEKGAFSRYALEGQPVNDERLNIVPKQPNGFSLSFVIVSEGKYYGVFRGQSLNLRYWVGRLDLVGARRTPIALTMEDLTQGSRLWNFQIKNRFLSLKMAMEVYSVGYQDIGCAYLFESIYQLLK